MPTIGQVVKDLRNRRGIPQDEIPRLSHNRLKTSWIAALETDRIDRPPKEKLEILAKVLGTTALEILHQAGEVDLPTPEGLTPEERLAFEKFRKLPHSLRTAAMHLIEDLSRADAIEYASRGERRKGRDGVAKDERN
jgi:transcriptional regulator with XRE-family HTH domain